MTDRSRPVESDDEEERVLSWRRIKIALLGSILAIVIGIIAVSIYTKTQYGGTPFDEFLGIREEESPAIGKLAYTKGTEFFIGVVKGEGINTRRVKVYYIEQAGGSMIEVAQERVELREPGRR